jgi:glycosyltransferase involved in cell wall biosynthesis
MRIWIINHYAAPAAMAGGTRHYNFAKQLIQRGHDVVLIASNYNHFSHSYIQPHCQLGEVDATYDVPFIWIPSPSYRGNTFSRFWNMLVFSRRLLQKKYLPVVSPPDVIIGSSPHLFAALGAQLLAKRLNKPFLLEIRDLWPDSLVDLGRISTHHPMIMLMKSIEKYLYRKSDRIISLLPSVNDYLVNYGVNPKHIHWLPNAVDIDVISQQMPVVKQDKFTFMYAGAHGLANDLDTLIKAAKILEQQSLSHHIRICLIGEGPEKTRLKALASEQGVTNVEFMDAVSKHEIYSILNQADAFLMLLKDSPLFRWGISPNKLFDYLAMARPIIFGVETSYNPVEKYNAGISVKPSNPASLANAMHQLTLLSKQELTEMGLRGKAFVLEHHHLVTLTDRLENIALEACTSMEN